MTQPGRTEYITDEAELLAEILTELKRQGEMLERAMGFLDNPVARYRQSMKEAKRDRGRT